VEDLSRGQCLKATGVAPAVAQQLPNSLFNQEKEARYIARSATETDQDLLEEIFKDR